MMALQPSQTPTRFIYVEKPTGNLKPQEYKPKSRALGRRFETGMGAFGLSMMDSKENLKRPSPEPPKNLLDLGFEKFFEN